MGARQWAPFLRLLSVSALFLVLTGCDSVELFGPTWVHNHQVVTYTLDMEPYSDHVNATVFVVIEVPVEWSPVDWSFSGTIDGEPVQGNGVWMPGDPGHCPKSPPPAGYTRFFAESGVFFDLEPGRDQVDAQLSFSTGDAAGAHRLTVWVEAVDDDDVTCPGPSPLTLDVQQWERLEWEQLIGTSSPISPGLGGVPGSHWGRTEFGGAFYTAFEPDDQISEIWRTSDFVNWELVRSVVAAEYAYVLFVFDGRLMMIASHDPAGAPPLQFELWASDDGNIWDLLNVWHYRPIRLIASPGLLVAILIDGDGYEQDYYLETTENGTDWTVFGGAPFAGDSSRIYDGVFFGGVFFLGGSIHDGLTDEWSPEVWRFDGMSIETIDTTQIGSGDSTSISAFAVDEDRIYLGTRADLGGEVWWFEPPTRWEQIGDFGIGLPGEGFIRDLAIGSGSLFALPQRDDDRATQIWWADQNFIWSKSDLDGVTSGSFVFRMSATGHDVFAASDSELWRRVLLFEDGFETQDLSRWSSTYQ